MSKLDGLDENTRILPANTRLRLILVRHGESVANVKRVLQGQSPGELTAKGIQQARLLGKYLQRVKIDRIVASDLQRVRQTVAQISSALQLPVTETAVAREWNVGILDGQPQSALQEAVVASGKSLFEFTPQGGERLQDVFNRAADLIRDLVEQEAGITVLLVSHGDFLRMLLGFIQTISLAEANNIHLDNTAYSIADLDAQGLWKIHTLNNTSYLNISREGSHETA